MPIAAITTLGKTVLLVVAVTFILWSLYTAMVVPKRRPGFPKRLDGFIALSALLFVAQLSAVVWVTGTQEIEEEEAAIEQPVGTTEEPVTTTETQPSGEGDATAGKEVYASAGCGSCHTLADAGSTGEIGPNLDDSKPSYELVVDRVTNGKGSMPPFSGQLAEDEIASVAAYVSTVAGTS